MSSSSSLTMDGDAPPGAPMSRRKKIAYAAAALTVTALFVSLALFVWDDHEALRAQLEAFLEGARGSPWALPIVIGCYIVGGLVMFPITLLNLVVAVVFGLWGIVYGLIGVMANTAFFYGIGLLMKKYGGEKWLEHPKIKPVDRKIKDMGLAALVAFHALPAPPFSILNLIAGISSVTAFTYFLSTFLAMLPGAISRGVLGEGLAQMLVDPKPESILYIAGGIGLWVVLVGSAHFILKKFEKKEAA